MLAEGRATIGPGRAFETAMLVLDEPELTKSLVELLWDEDTGVAGRAADALEAIALEAPGRLGRYKEALLGLMAEAGGIKLRRHLALTLTRLKLTGVECRRAAGVLNGWLDDRSSIVKTCAMQALAELSCLDPEMREGVLDMLRVLSRSGTPAMRARGRVLVEQMEKSQDVTWLRAKQQARAAARLVH